MDYQPGEKKIWATQITKEGVLVSAELPPPGGALTPLSGVLHCVGSRVDRESRHGMCLQAAPPTQHRQAIT